VILRSSHSLSSWNLYSLILVFCWLLKQISRAEHFRHTAGKKLFTTFIEGFLDDACLLQPIWFGKPLSYHVWHLRIAFLPYSILREVCCLYMESICTACYHYGTLTSYSMSILLISMNESLMFYSFKTPFRLSQYLDTYYSIRMFSRTVVFHILIEQNAALDVTCTSVSIHLHPGVQPRLSSYSITINYSLL
jgi:hypothetical protein